MVKLNGNNDREFNTHLAHSASKISNSRKDKTPGNYVNEILPPME